MGEPVPTKIHWRQTFEIQGDKVSVINTTSELDVEKDGVTKRKVPEKDEVTQMQNNTIILGGSKGNLNLVFLKPKQSNCDATITKVLSDRLGVTDEKVLDQYKKHFVGKEGGINMMKIRVKVSFFNSARALICSSISPQTVVDNGSKKIGCMEMYDCWPRKSSPTGGRKIMMISEYDLADDVVPRFELYDGEGIHRTDVQDWIVQPIKSASTMAIKNATIIFLTPAQPHLEKMQNQIGSFSLKLVAHRQGDGMTSKAFAFEYTSCCDHRMDGGLIQTDSTNNLKTFKDEDFSPSTGPPEDGVRSRHANRVQNKTTNVSETVENSTSKTDLAQLLMVFTVFFILLLCVVQISSNSLGLPLTTLPLIGITSVLSLGVVGAKFAKA